MPHRVTSSLLLAASLGYLMLGQTEAVGLAMVGGRVESWLPPHAGTAQLARVIEALERMVPAGESDLGRAVQEVADRLERRSLVIVLSDGWRRRNSSLRRRA